MNEQSQAKSPEALRAMVAGTLANFQHPTLKHNLTTLESVAPCRLDGRHAACGTGYAIRLA